MWWGIRIGCGELPTHFLLGFFKGTGCFWKSSETIHDILWEQGFATAKDYTRIEVDHAAWHKRMLRYSQDWAGRTCDSKKRRVLGKNPSTFLWFHHIYAKSHLYPAGRLNLRWMSLKPGNWCQLAHVHLPSPPALQNDRRCAGLWRLCVAQQSRDEGILQGIPILRGGLDFGCMPFSILCITIKIIQLGLLLSTWETSHGWWFTSKYWKTLRFKLQRYRCPERRKMGFSLASGVLQRSDLHWPWSAPKKRLMGMVHKESPERTAMCLWHIETLHQLTAPMEMSVVCN